MRYDKFFIQMNALVFDEVISDGYQASFKTFESEYGSSHGSYFPQKRKGGLLRASSVTMTLIFHMRILPCEIRPFFPDFVKEQLTTQGKLWAIQNGTLIWAYAVATAVYDRVNTFNDNLEVDVEFYLPEGVWHKADKQRTFLLDYDPCELMECYEFMEIQPCNVGDCCNCGPDVVGACDCECCDEVNKEQALCYNLDKIKDFVCGRPDFRVIYDCDAAERFFNGSFLSDERMGQKFCATCGEIIAGQFYSETVIPTDMVKITLLGKFKNPYIEINGNGNYIKGEYDGVLEVFGDGKAYFGSEGCKPCELLPVSAWVIPEGSEYGWTVYPRKNRILIDGGACCTYCAWVQDDPITI